LFLFSEKFMKLLFWLLTVVFGSGALEAAIARTPTGPNTVLSSDKARTYREVGAENGFTPLQWDRFYDEMQGFRYVNGIKVRELTGEKRRSASTALRQQRPKQRPHN
jgi:hypothetical protein